DAPFAIKRRKEDGGFFYEGYCIDLLNELARKLKFTYEVYISPDGKYGAENENGTWNGVINEILNERTDMAISALTITERREKVVDFSFPFMHFTTDILLRKPSFGEKIDLSQFMAPFDNQVWFATLATLVIISIAVFVLNFYSPYGYKDDNGRGTSKEFSFFNTSKVITLIEGGVATTSACALSTMTGIPVIRLYGNISPLDQCEKEIRMSAGYRDYAQATLDILKKYGWKNIVLVYEERRVHEAGHFLTKSRKLPLIVNLVQLSGRDKNEKPTEPAHRVIEQVRKFDAQVIVLYLENKNIELLLQQVPLNFTWYQNVVIALKLPHAETSLVDEIKHAVGHNFTGFINEELVAVSHDAVQIIQEAANTEPCSSINGSDIRLEDRNTMLTCMRKSKFYCTTQYLHFGNGNIIVKVESPYVMKRKKNDGELFYEGYCIDLLNELARNLKFTYEIYTSPDGKYGAEMEDGTWNGAIGEIINENAKIIFDRGRRIYASSGVESPYGYKDDNGRGTSKEFSFFNSVWFALACMLQQGGDNTPKSLSGRILTGCYWFCILICISTYTANLAAFFTVKNAVHPIQNLGELTESSYSIAVLNSSSMSEFFKASDYEAYKKIWRKIEGDDTLVKTVAQGVQWVREKEHFALITDGPSLRKIVSKPPCDLEVALSRKQIGLNSMLGVYLVLFVGMVIAFFTLLTEIYWKRRAKQGFISGQTDEFHALNSVFSYFSGLKNVSVVLKEFNISEVAELFGEASNVITLIEGGVATTSACALSTMTGIPLIRLYGNIAPLDQCEKEIRMSAGYRDYAQATLDILEKYGWKNIVLVNEASNVITLIEGGAAATSACTLSTLTGIPLIRLYGNIIGPQDQCKKSIQMSAGYKDYAHATLEILKNYGWKNVVVVYEELRVHEAGNFLTVSRKFPLIINLVQLSEGEKNEEATEPSYRVIEQVQKFDPEVIVLYLEDKNIEQILQQGTVAVGYDTFQIIKKAANTWPCSSINGSDISLEDRNAIFTCMRKASSEEEHEFLQFMDPFDRQVWFANLATLVISSIAVFVINYYSPYGCKDDNGRGTSKEFSFFNSVWFALACMLQQGGDNSPKSLSALSQKQIDLKSMVGFFLVLLVGMVIAFLTLLAEIYWKRRSKQVSFESY
ncbi:Glutamate receptor ionotropic, kainate 3, partial [Stylophora pistillata]